jgi:starch phosphorylase
MKAVANGALHFSVLDGWWDEGYDREVGWAIGNGEEYEDHDFQDALEGRALYDILEKDVVPLFYDRGTDGIPRRWVAMMKASMYKLCPMFNTHRMVEEYWEKYYLPAAERGYRLMENGGEDLKKLSEWRKRIMYNWGEVAIRSIQMQTLDEVELGQSFHVEAEISLGELSPDDLVVEAYCGRVDPSDEYMDRFLFPMSTTGDGDGRVYHYAGDVLFHEAGHFGVNVRVVPNHPDSESRHSMGLVIWGESQ